MDDTASVNDDLGLNLSCSFNIALNMEAPGDIDSAIKQLEIELSEDIKPM
jgi:hypothetical protein